MLQGRSVAVSVVSTLRVSSESMASKQTIFPTILRIGTLKHVILISNIIFFQGRLVRCAALVTFFVAVVSLSSYEVRAQRRRHFPDFATNDLLRQAR